MSKKQTQQTPHGKKLTLEDLAHVTGGMRDEHMKIEIKYQGQQVKAAI